MFTMTSGETNFTWVPGKDGRDFVKADSRILQGPLVDDRTELSNESAGCLFLSPLTEAAVTLRTYTYPSLCKRNLTTCIPYLLNANGVEGIQWLDGDITGGRRGPGFRS
ncbi:hypothetical protein VNO77_03003 [Canavalia gladiata]|uniref:Uncharacterized protein n=1 Tax=Canavalia gladiata TaxID=3824 RepID=A0AAN9MZ66_CANGL